MLRLLREGELPGIELGETWLVSEEGLIEFLHAEEKRQFEARRTSGGRKLRQPRTRRRTGSKTTGIIEFTVLGKHLTARANIDVLTDVLRELSANDPDFLRRFSKAGGRSRRYVADDPSLLYPGRPDLADTFSKRLTPEWWIGTNYSARDIESILKKACRVAGLRWGTDLIFGQKRVSDRARALDFVGIGTDAASDVARRHDDYFAESTGDGKP